MMEKTITAASPVGVTARIKAHAAISFINLPIVN